MTATCLVGKRPKSARQGDPCWRLGRLLEDEGEHHGRQPPNPDVAEPEHILLEESMHAVKDHPPIIPNTGRDSRDRRPSPADTALRNMWDRP